VKRSRRDLRPIARDRRKWNSQTTYVPDGTTDSIIIIYNFTMHVTSLPFHPSRFDILLIFVEKIKIPSLYNFLYPLSATFVIGSN
jgi:hypothetical protein